MMRLRCRFGIHLWVWEPMHLARISETRGRWKQIGTCRWCGRVRVEVLT